MSFSNYSFQISLLHLILSIFLLSCTIEAEEEPEFPYPDVFNDTNRDALISGTFRDDFIWGVATTAYQIEGAWNTDGKGESIWDNFTHLDPCKLENCDNGDVACDSYHKYDSDVKMLKDLGVTHYSFSLSWSRIMPKGEGEVNELGLQYYDRLIDTLTAEGIEPVITLLALDFPQTLQDKYGGWESSKMTEIFNAYADICFNRWANKVKMWITFSYPATLCEIGYGYGIIAPGIEDYHGYAPYRCAHNIIRSHGMAYRTYESKYKAAYGGKVSIGLHMDYAIPENPDNATDVEAADRLMQFSAGWFAHPIMINGDYPDVMKSRVGTRLPAFTEEEKQMIKDTGDFFGLISFASYIVKDATSMNDKGVDIDFADEWPTIDSLEFVRPVPWGMRELLNWINDKYNLPIYILENGFPTTSDSFIDDPSRTTYYKAYINEALKAYKEDSVDLRGYFAYTLMDSFEWFHGYSDRWGLYHVDFEDDDRKRTRKNSADFYSQIIKDNGFSTASMSMVTHSADSYSQIIKDNGSSTASMPMVSLLLLLPSAVCVRFLY